MCSNLAFANFMMKEQREREKEREREREGERERYCFKKLNKYKL
jgi:hypothetical protein